MNVLLSIKPEFAQKILALDKQYEFRKTAFRDSNLVEKIYMYASSPVKKIVGHFSIDGVIEQHPEQLWTQFGQESGVENRDAFLDYFEGKEMGYALEIDTVQEFADPIDPRDYVRDFHPPMSFQYLNGDFDFLR